MQSTASRRAPASAHLASVAPQPNSMSSGCAPIASARARHRKVDGDRHRGADRDAAPRARARSSATSTSKPSSGSRTMRTVEPARRAASAVPGRGTRPVRERERRARPGATSTGVPSSRWSGTITATGAAPSPVTASSDDASGRSACTIDDAVEPAVARPRAARGGRGVERARVGDDGAAVLARPTRRPRARSMTTTIGSRRRRASTTRSAIARASASRASSVEHVGEPRLAVHERPQRDRRSRRRRSRDATRHGLRMLPSRGSRSIPGAKARVLCPGSAVRLALDDRGRGAHPGARAGDPREQPRLVSRSADARVRRRSQRGRRVRFLAKAELFDKPGLGPLLRAAHQIPVHAARPTPPARSAPRSTRCAQRRVRRGVSRRDDLARPRADAREVGNGAARAGGGRAGRAGRAVGHAPHPDEGPQARAGSGASREVAVVGEPVDDRAGRARASDATDAHHGRDQRVRRARRARSTRNGRRPATTRGGGAIPRPPASHQSDPA